MTLSELHSILVTQVPKMDEKWKEQIRTQQFPSNSKRGGLGFGGHAKITAGERSQFCNINLFGLDVLQPRFELKQTASVNDFAIIDIYSNQTVGKGKFFSGLAWYDATLANGKRITDVLQAHMGKEAVTVIGKTRCVGFDENTACKYCSLSGGTGNPNRTAEEIVEALEIALQFGWKPASLALTTTWIDESNSLEQMSDGLALLRSKFPLLPIAFETQPSTRPYWDYQLLKNRGINTLMIPMDSLEQAQDITPIKANSVSVYLNALKAARKIFPISGAVTSPIIVGFDPLPTTLGLIKTLVSIGVKPEPVPLRVFDDRLSVRTNSSDLEIAKQLTKNLWSETFGNARVSAGCSQCGGCSGV